MAPGVFMVLHFLVMFDFATVLGWTSRIEVSLTCDPILYPIEWMTLYMFDYFTGALSILFYQFYDQYCNLYDPKNLEELQALKKCLTSTYNA